MTSGTTIQMKPNWRHWVNKEGGHNTGKYYEFRCFKVYWAFRLFTEEEIKRIDFEESFTGRLLMSGFIPRYNLHPTNNWFGISRYDPDNVFIKGSKEIIMSMQGMCMPYPHRKEDQDLARSMSCKYVGMFDNNQAIYETWSGELPPKDIYEKFTKN